MRSNLPASLGMKFMVSFMTATIEQTHGLTITHNLYTWPSSRSRILTHNSSSSTNTSSPDENHHPLPLIDIILLNLYQLGPHPIRNEPERQNARNPRTAKMMSSPQRKCVITGALLPRGQSIFPCLIRAKFCWSFKLDRDRPAACFHRDPLSRKVRE